MALRGKLSTTLGRGPGNHGRRGKLITDVQLRLGDVQILRQEFDEAIIHLDQAYKTAETDDEKSYALFRQAYEIGRASCRERV